MHVVNKYWFGIVRVENDRYSWIFVKTGNGKLRVLARSDRDYRSKTKAGKAIEKVRDAVEDAKVYDATGPFSFPLPTTSFEIDPDVVPLMVGRSRPDHGKRKKAKAQPASQ